jgi:hypothetical protein
MTQILFGSINRSFENHAPGRLFLFPYPASNPGSTLLAWVNATLALLFGTDTTYTQVSSSSGGTATVTTAGVLTIVAAPTTGALVLGSMITMAGLPFNSIVQSLISGTLGAVGSTYQLSIPPPATISATTSFTSALQQWGDMDESGLQLKVDVDKLEFPHNDGSVPGVLPSQVKSAMASINIYDADANHWADVFGALPADVVTQVADGTHAGFTAVALGLPNASQKWVAILAMESATPGQLDFLILPRINFLTQPDVKYSSKDKIELKTDLACNGDLYLSTAQGVPVFSVVVTVTAPAT